jgi:glucose/mannose-6-phosphate isomerase
MGGSGFPGAILSSYINLDVPVVLHRSYSLPKWVNKDTLVFVVSYSGTTEESLSAYKEAISRKAKVVSLASGGLLRSLCTKNKTPFIQVPEGLVPRDAIGYQTIPLLNVLQNSKLIDNQSNAIAETLTALRKDYKEKAEELAKKLVNKVPLIYSSENLECLARIWKSKINENAKSTAFFNVFPELNHNEIESYNHVLGNYYVIIINDVDDIPRIKTRMEVMKTLIQEQDVPVLELKLTGKNKLARIFSSILLGSYVGYYLALEYKLDPADTDLLDNFKKQILQPEK